MTVAVWPTLTLPISDSLSGTTSCIELRSLRTANAVLAELDPPEEPDALEEPEELDEPAPERPEEEAPVPDPDDADPEDPDPLEEPALEALVVPCAETSSPTSPVSETIVPVLGAYSFVSASACSSPSTASLSLCTAARAEAMLASRTARLSGSLDVLDEDEDGEDEDGEGDDEGEEEEEEGDDEGEEEEEEGDDGDGDDEPPRGDEPVLSRPEPDGDSVAGCETAAALPSAVVFDPEPEPDEVSPSFSSTCARFATAACRVARDCSSVTSAVLGFSSPNS